MKIKKKIFAVILIITALSTAGGFGILYHFSAENLRVRIYDHLEATAKNKANWINFYFSERRGDTFVLATSPAVKQALTAGTSDFETSPAAKAQLQQKYLRDYKKTYGILRSPPRRKTTREING
jgi:hypothetical protein